MSRSRRHLRITREGWSFVFILCFIIIGSVLQQINLLVMLAGLMIAPLLFNWRIALNSIFQLTLKRQLPQWAHAGQTVLVEWSATNNRQLLPSWGIKITDSIWRSDISEKKATKIDAIFAQINPNAQNFASYRCHFGQRGIYHFGKAEVSSKFPLGLAKAWYTEHGVEDFVVAPKLGTLKDAWSKKLQSAAVGLRSASRLRGFSQDEFYALRPWRAGDSRRWIHWRSTARLGQPIVKQFDQQTDHDYAIALDLWQPADSAAEFIDTSESAVSFAATIVANVRQKVKGNIAIGLCGDKTATFSDRVTPEFTASIMRELAVIQPNSGDEIFDCLGQISRSVSASAPIIVVSTRSKDEVMQKLDQHEDVKSIVMAATWIEVGSDEFQKLFELNNRSATNDFLTTESNDKNVTRTPLVPAV